MIINRRGTGTHTIISGTPATILNKRWIGNAKKYEHSLVINGNNGATFKFNIKLITNSSTSLAGDVIEPILDILKLHDNLDINTAATASGNLGIVAISGLYYGADHPDWIYVVYNDGSGSNGIKGKWYTITDTVTEVYKHSLYINGYPSSGTGGINDVEFELYSSSADSLSGSDITPIITLLRSSYHTSAMRAVAAAGYRSFYTITGIYSKSSTSGNLATVTSSGDKGEITIGTWEITDTVS